jgi:hypothetical protein
MERSRSSVMTIIFFDNYTLTLGRLIPFMHTLERSWSGMKHFVSHFYTHPMERSRNIEEQLINLRRTSPTSGTAEARPNFRQQNQAAAAAEAHHQLHESSIETLAVQRGDGHLHPHVPDGKQRGLQGDGHLEPLLPHVPDETQQEPHNEVYHPLRVHTHLTEHRRATIISLNPTDHRRAMGSTPSP